MARLWIILALLTLFTATCPGSAAYPSPSEGEDWLTAEPLPEAGLQTAPACDPLFAGFLSGLSGRGRAIQISIVLMCVALFILIKKFAEAGPVRGPSSPVRGKEPSVGAPSEDRAPAEGEHHGPQTTDH